jgi:hypothetical protein
VLLSLIFPSTKFRPPFFAFAAARCVACGSSSNYGDPKGFRFGANLQKKFWSLATHTNPEIAIWSLGRGSPANLHSFPLFFKEALRAEDYPLKKAKGERMGRNII